MSEDSIVRAIKRLLQQRRAWHIKTTGVALAGCPDILCCYRGVFLAIEVKTPHGIVRPNQRRQLELIADTGGMAIIARNQNDVVTVLDELDEYADRVTSALNTRPGSKEAD